MRGRIQPKDLEIGQRILAQRKLKKMTQTDLARKIGVTFQQVQKYENGTNRVGGGRLRAIATALGVAPSFLFGENVHHETDATFRMLKRSDSVRLIKAFDKAQGPQSAGRNPGCGRARGKQGMTGPDAELLVCGSEPRAAGTQREFWFL
jgi:transcriptional regulator with XRE-family HTH domain